MREIVHFARTIKHKLTSIVSSDNLYRVHFVMGNSSCEMDSFASSLALSFFRNIKSGFLSTSSSQEVTYHIQKENNIYVPIVNCVEGELFWRLEICKLLKKLGLNEDDFFYFNASFDKSNLSFSPFSSCTELKKDNFTYSFILVDHHELDGSQIEIASIVEEIIDHHEDNGFSYETVFPKLIKKRVEFPRCSAMSFIIEEFFYDEAYSKTRAHLLSSNIFDLLLAPMVLDSANFNSKTLNIRWVPIDKQLSSKVIEYANTSLFYDIVEEIEKKDDFDFRHFEFLFNLLSKAKFDRQLSINLGPKSLLNKDRKDFTVEMKDNKILSVTFSSLSVPFSTVVKEYTIERTTEILEELAFEKSTDIFVIIFREDNQEVCALHYISTAGKERYPALFSKEGLENYLNSICNSLRTESIVSLCRISLNEVEKNFVSIETQGELSRKLFWPLFKNYFSSQ